MSSIYEWADRALALPGAPDIWLRAADGKGLITVDGDEGLYGIASDGTWWGPTGRADRPWVLAVDHPATAGCLLALLGAQVFSVWMASNWREGDDKRIGRACIRVAASIGRWPGGAECGGWISWMGGECPMEGSVVVEAILRDGTRCPAEPARVFEWGAEGNGGDIVRYRIVSPAIGRWPGGAS
jgi:hypothetical protein